MDLTTKEVIFGVLGIVFVYMVVKYGFGKALTIFLGAVVTIILSFFLFWIVVVAILIFIIFYFILKKKIKIYTNYYKGNAGWQNSGKWQDYGSYQNAGSYTRVEDLTEAYREMGIEEGITDEELKKAHRDMVKKYHPDIHAYKGEEERKINEIKLKKINEAYDRIRKSRGI